MLTILQIVLPFLIKMVGAYLDKSKATKEQREKWLAFLNSIQGTAQGSAKIKDSYEEQLKKLRGEV